MTHHPKARPKILMVTRLFPSNSFPTQGTFCAERAKALARYAEVRVLVPTPYFPRWLPGCSTWRQHANVERTEITAEGVPVSYPRYLSIPKVATWSQGLAMTQCVYREVVRGDPRWVPDIVDGHFAFPDGYASVRLARRLGCASMVTCHGSDLRTYPSLLLTGRLLRWTMRQADCVVSVSGALRDRSVELGCPEPKAVVLVNGVDTDRFCVRSKEECRQRVGLTADRPVAVCIGHLIDRKNQIVLIRTLAELAGQNLPVPLLVLVGNGPNMKSLERETERLGVQRHVCFAGQRPYPEIPYWVGAADWLVLSSHYEGWPTVYHEAFACGRPVITSNVNSAREAVPSDAYGLVVEKNTPQAFAEAMTRAMAMPFDPEVLRAKAQRHSWDQWARSALTIMCHLLAERRARR